MNLSLTDTFIIAEYDVYRFGIGNCHGRWIGFAMESAFAHAAKEAFRSESLEVDPSMLFVLPEVAEAYQLGMLDREKAILLTGAVAQDPESSYGGVERWFVPEGLRGDPEKFRCGHCDVIGCDGKLCQEYDEGDYDGDYP